ncbi:MAG: hypothetical protein DMF62_06145 [Acidobacteria bacterium]|nr:MAG: hypothetical protein DMF62_06145 [Acidobacteriota bacterium]
MNFLAFEVNVLSRIDFDSMAMPFADRPDLGLAMKRRGKRVLANSVLRSEWNANLATIQNNTDRLSDADLQTALEDAYVPGYKLAIPALQKYFSETDAWWFDNVRRNLDRIESPYIFALAAMLAMEVGDYVLSFDETTRELRQPLSAVYRRLWKNLPSPFNNSQNNSCQNKAANEFLAENFVDLLFLRIPQIGAPQKRAANWREDWLNGANKFQPLPSEIESRTFGSSPVSKSQRLRSLEEMLTIASNIKHWAIAHSDGGQLTTQDIIDVVTKLRRVDKVYTKDFSELTGIKASIITA